MSSFRWINFSHFATSADAAIRSVTVLLLPFLIAAASLTTVLLGDDVYKAEEPRALLISAIAQPSGTWGPSDAVEALKQVQPEQYHDTRLTERPVWFKFDLDQQVVFEAVAEFPSRHARQIACWNADTLAPMGSAGMRNSAGAMSEVKAGFGLAIGKEVRAVVCQALFTGPARVSANLWIDSQLTVSSNEFHRRSGLIDGGLLVLALFVLITAIVNRQTGHLLFAAWLFVTTRLAATSGGWDDQWLNHAIPIEWLPSARTITRAFWALLTVSIFRVLFEADLKRLNQLKIVAVAQWLCMGLVASAILLPRSIYYPVLWLVGGLVLVVFFGSLVAIVVKIRSRVSILFGAAFAVTLLSTLAEILAAAFGAQGLIGSTNGVVAALATGLLAALAIAEQMRQEHMQRLQAQAELQHTFDAVPVGLFSLDAEGRFFSANPAMCQRLGADWEQVERSSWHNYFSADEWIHLREKADEVANVEIEVRDCLLPGAVEPRSFLIKATRFQDKIEGSLQDVTEKLRAADHLQFIANHDMLTQAMNRRGVEKEIESALRHASAKHPLTLVYLNLDRFKLVNELYGRNAGDAVLQHVCSRVSTLLSPHMKLGRLGGDEFLLVMPDSPVDLAKILAERIIESISGRPFVIVDKAFHVRCSAGLIELAAGAVIKDCIATAERACRQAKTHDGNRLSVYRKGAPAFADYEAEIMLVELLADPAATQAMYLHMQPIMSLGAPFDSLNFEVLLRMRDPEGSTVRTDHLIRAAESSGRVGMVDRWVLSTLFTWLNQHYAQLQHTRFVCVNLNGASLNDERFLEDVVTMLAANHAVAHHVCFEITESVALHDLNNTRRFISKVRSFGTKVALDDFGAGYTSFSYLKDLPADLLKIDGSFIVDMNQHPANVAIVEAIVNLAGNLGMKTIAEWAEDAATVRTLRDLGVDYVQGYVVARPMEPERLLGARSSADFITDDRLRDVFLQPSQIGTSSKLQDDLFDGDAPVRHH